MKHLADQATLGKRASTLGRRLAAVRYFHRAAGYSMTSPAGIRRATGSRLSQRGSVARLAPGDGVTRGGIFSGDRAPPIGALAASIAAIAPGRAGAATFQNDDHPVSKGPTDCVEVYCGK
jgi:hypothetical protein